MAIIKTENLSKVFGDFTAVNRISFEVERGEIFGFLGANGAGKTTAMRMLCGLLTPSDGRAEVAGFDVYSQSEEIKKNIGYMSQKFSLYEDLTVYENMRFYGGVYGMGKKDISNRSAELLEQLGLAEIRKKMVKDLPLGIRQKLSFANALMHRPEIIFLDEPTGGVDPITRRQFWEMIYDTAAKGTTIFVTTHYMDEAEYCDRISMMVDGYMKACDTPQGLISSYDAANMDEVFVKLARSTEVGD